MDLEGRQVVALVGEEIQFLALIVLPFFLPQGVLAPHQEPVEVAVEVERGFQALTNAVLVAVEAAAVVVLLATPEELAE